MYTETRVPEIRTVWDYVRFSQARRFVTARNSESSLPEALRRIRHCNPRPFFRVFTHLGTNSFSLPAKTSPRASLSTGRNTYPLKLPEFIAPKSATGQGSAKEQKGTFHLNYK